MHCRRKGKVDNCRLVDIPTGAEYAGMGKTSFRKWADEIGALRRFGRSVRCDLKVIDMVLDRMGEGKEG